MKKKPLVPKTFSVRLSVSGVEEDSLQHVLLLLKNLPGTCRQLHVEESGARVEYTQEDLPF